MIKLLFGFVLVTLSFSICNPSLANTTAPNMEICVASASPQGCSDVLLSSVPSISTADQLRGFFPPGNPEAWALLFGDASRTTFVPPPGETWTIVPTLSWDAGAISRPIFCGANVFADCSFNGFEMDWPVANGPDAGRSILVDLSVTMFDASGGVVASTSGNEFRLFTPVPEPSTVLLYATGLGLIGLILYSTLSRLPIRTDPLPKA